MHTHRLARRLSVVSAAALAAATLSVAPAQAAPVFTVSDLDVSSGVHDDASCTENPGAVISPDVDNQPVTENGAPVTATSSASGSVTDGATDTQTGASNISVTASVSSTGTTLKSMELATQGSVSITNTVADSTCDIHVWSEADLDFTFTVAQAGFLTVVEKSRGGAYSEIYLEANLPPSSPYHQQYNEGISIDSSKVLYLPAGTYSGYFYGEFGRSQDSAVSFSGNTSMKATFAVAGSQSAATAGKGAKYLTFADSARNCGTDTVTGAVTSNKGRAKKITQVTVFVNGAKKAKVKNPGKGEAVVLSGIADGVDADIRAVVKLEKKANGKPRKPVEVTASYVACSPSA